ncbi:MAG: surface carbohydrate biosynthesis protein [Xanthobacteraceae bacterium]
MKTDRRLSPPVVMLVDNRRRDLDVAVLIANRLRSLGVECILEPLEAYGAVLAAYRPGMVVINHLFASHLAAWSRRLQEMGVLTAVLSNEGIIRNAEARRFQSGRYHRDGHVDYFFCWNELHRDALLQEGIYRGAQVEVVGVPRFDLYFEPWSRLLHPPKCDRRARPRILICTNVGLAKFREIPRELGDRHFAQWANHIPNYGDYWKRVETQWKARQRFVEHSAVLAATGRYDIVLRPHPSEDVEFYQEWLSSLPPAQRDRVRIDSNGNISSLIMDCDLEIADESCTTAVESWIAGKPTIGLVFDRNSPLYFEERSRCHIHCDDPEKLPALVEQQLANPSQSELQEVRRQHLAKWCASPDGKSCQRVAEIAANAVLSKRPSDWSKLTANDYRRAAKLRAYRKLGLAYHYDPLLTLKRALFGNRYAIKHYSYEKSIKPRDVVAARERLGRALESDADRGGSRPA